MIKFTKENQRELNHGDVHDAILKEFSFFPLEKTIKAVMHLYYGNRDVNVKFHGVTNFKYVTSSLLAVDLYGTLYGWEEIPNKYNPDSYLEDMKIETLSSEDSVTEWNENQFAVSIIFTDMSKINIICNLIEFDVED